MENMDETYFLTPISGNGPLNVQKTILELNQQDIKKATREENRNREISNNLHSAINNLNEHKINNNHNFQQY